MNKVDFGIINDLKDNYRDNQVQKRVVPPRIELGSRV